MKLVSEKIRLAATDLSNHLACHHLTRLDVSVARGTKSAPDWESPDLWVIQQLGLRHEAEYLAFLQKDGLSIENLAEAEQEDRALAVTRESMTRGVDVIAQGSLAVGRWFGRPDILRRVPRQSRLGPWSYE